MDLFGNNPFGGAGQGLFEQFAQGFGGAMGHPRRRPPRAYDEYMKAYSVAMLPGKERTNLSYGGKIIMPPSALANLTALDLESPWMFQLRNPANPAASTHAGVLEFIAEEGVVHLPYWMMKTLRLNEGDPIRITGAELPKGQLVKLQAQSTHFLEISDPKAVLEQALRNFSALTQGDIIEIMYNSIVFELLIMETTPGGSGISVLDTDLEVDFAAPKGYVEPERPKAAPPPTMASKLNIDLNSSTPGSSRPSSALSGAFAGTSTGKVALSKGGDDWESFKGRGETLGGRKTKGKGISQRKIEDHMDSSKIFRTDNRKIVSNDTLESDVKAPAPLNLPFGQLFFGFRIAPYVKPADAEVADKAQSSAFSGSGATLSGRQTDQTKPADLNSKGKGKEEPSAKSWGSGGQTLGAPRAAPASSSSARSPRPTARTQKPPPRKKERSPTPDWGVDDDDVIPIDSD